MFLPAIAIFRAILINYINTIVIVFTHNPIWEKVWLLLSHFADEETEALRGPRSYLKETQPDAESVCSSTWPTLARLKRAASPLPEKSSYYPALQRGRFMPLLNAWPIRAR